MDYEEPDFCFCDSRCGCGLCTVVDWFLEAENTNFGLEYRMNSRLLVITGTPGTYKRAGKFYYEWKDNRLRFVKFVKEELN